MLTKTREEIKEAFIAFLISEKSYFEFFNNIKLYLGARREGAYNSIEKESPENWIITSFSWPYTNQGQHHWYMLHVKWNKKCADNRWSFENYKITRRSS